MLLDTSGLLALHDQGFHGHASAVEYFQLASQRLTHNYVLAEFVALVTARGFMRAPAFQFLQEIVQQVEVVWVDTNLHTQAFAYLTSRQDKQYSLCDAVSFVLMEQRGITDALTTDRHFAQAGFVKLLQAWRGITTLGIQRQLANAGLFVGALVEQMAEVDSSTRRFPLSEYQQRANSPRPEFEDCLMGASIAKRFGYLHEDRPQEAFSAQVASFRMKLGRGDVDGGGDGAAGIGVGISDIYARDRHYYPAQ